MITANFEAIRPAAENENLSLSILRALVEEPYQTLEQVRSEQSMDERIVRRHLFYLQESGLVSAIQAAYDVPRFHATREGKRRIAAIDERMKCACEQKAAPWWASWALVVAVLVSVVAFSSC